MVLTLTRMLPLPQSPYHANLLIAGYDENGGASLYYLDYLATMHKMNVAGTGYGAYFVLSMMDRLWHPNMTQEEGVEMMKKGIDEVGASGSVALLRVGWGCGG